MQAQKLYLKVKMQDCLFVQQEEGYWQSNQNKTRAKCVFTVINGQSF